MEEENDEEPSLSAGTAMCCLGLITVLVAFGSEYAPASLDLQVLPHLGLGFGEGLGDRGPGPSACMPAVLKAVSSLCQLSRLWNARAGLGSGSRL